MKLDNNNNGYCPPPPEQEHMVQEKSKEWLEMDQLFDQLFPICRSITGAGLRETIAVLSEHIPLESFAVPTGTQIFDWEIPREWNIRSGWLKGPDGEIIADFQQSNLHIVNYSIAVDRKLSLSELDEHLFSVPYLPDAIPYVTSYYKERWGFCIPQSVREKLKEGEYHAYIDSDMTQGALNYAHAILPGETKHEVLISTYICHPSMANNELSGPLVATQLYKRIASWPRRRFSYRFVFVPETIGSLSYLHRFGEDLKKNLQAGLVLTCLGGQTSLSYKLSRSGHNPLDKIWEQITAKGVIEGSVRPFTPAYGSDERQYCSPGFNLPVGQVARSVYGTYAGYHNSYDTKEAMTIDALEQSLNELELLLQIHEADGYYINRFPYGEVKLDKHGLYPDINSPVTSSNSTNEVTDHRQQLHCILFLLNYADGKHTLSEISELCGYSVPALLTFVRILLDKGILQGPYATEGDCLL